MAYRIAGLDYAGFAPLFALDDRALAGHGACRVVADADRGFPCRVSLVDARAGETLVLAHHVSHDVATPFRSAYAIYVREWAVQAEFIDSAPPVFAGRWLALRGFRADGMLHDAALVAPGEADAGLRTMFAAPFIAYIDVHNAAAGCFAARATRHGDPA